MENTLLFGKTEPGITFKKLWRGITKYTQLRQKLRIIVLTIITTSSIYWKQHPFFLKDETEIDSIPQVICQLRTFQDIATTLGVAMFEK